MPVERSGDDPAWKDTSKNAQNSSTMTASSSDMLRSVSVNDRGQLVIPEEVRKELGIEGGSVLVLVTRGDEIVLRREQDVLEDFEGGVWHAARNRALDRAWGEEDEVWDEHAPGGQA